MVAMMNMVKRDVAALERTLDNARLIMLLAALSHQSDFAIGCYCEVEARCHRSVLRKLLAGHGASLE